MGEYTGTWIPAYIMLDKNLKVIDRAMYAEIASFIDCFASNEWFAERLGISERQVQRVLSGLKEAGYVEQTSFDGRKRRLQARQNEQGRHDINDVAEVSFMSPIDNSIKQKENKVSIIQKKSIIKLESSPEEIELTNYWAEAFGFPAKSTALEKRAIKKLLAQYPLSRIEVCIKVAAAGRSEKYCPVITSFVKLEEKWHNMEAYIARLVATQNNQNNRVTDLSNLR